MAPQMQGRIEPHLVDVVVERPLVDEADEESPMDTHVHSQGPHRELVGGERLRADIVRFPNAFLFDPGESPVDQQASGELRVELMGSGAVVEAHFDDEGAPANALTFLGVRFERP